MKATEFGKTFNTTLQNVDEKYKWVNDMIKARQELVLMYMKILNVSHAVQIRMMFATLLMRM